MKKTINKILVAILMLVFSVSVTAQNIFNSNNTAQKITNKKSKAPVGLMIGISAPELSFKNPEGKLMSLSDLKGKVVLIDFWASWCTPCRRENPNIVQAYKNYKSNKFKNGNGFEIYSLSLDKNKEAWKRAIKQDNLDWQSHVSDLGGWESKGSRKYKIRSIPSNVLINGDGIIIAKNLKGPALHRFLANYTK